MLQTNTHLMANQLDLYDNTSLELSRQVTKAYSTSFYTASKLFAPPVREAIWAVYGFVRLADEIVDTFDHIDQEAQLDRFSADFAEAMQQGLSLNPLLHAFQRTVKAYNIPDAYIQAFLDSMRLDLHKKDYTSEEETAAYIYGSADVVGLMCLTIFCHGDSALFEQLEAPARRLGSAFQKVNFLRDLKTDSLDLGRTYFSAVVGKSLDDNLKKQLEADIRQDFAAASQGVACLPRSSRLAVKVAFEYYKTLLVAIERTSPEQLLNERIRVSNLRKTVILLRCYLFHLLKRT
jgi:phytoene/squalene synthetase